MSAKSAVAAVKQYIKTTSDGNTKKGKKNKQKTISINEFQHGPTAEPQTG